MCLFWWARQKHKRFGKKKKCVSNSKGGVSIENREEGVRDRKQVIPESRIVQIKCLTPKRLVFHCLTTGKIGNTFI